MLLVAALGVVFGDIGTSPIYAFRESLRAAGGVEAQATVLGIVLLAIGLGGASLFFGDAMITPAISVLSAIEGLQIATPVFRPYVVPVAAVVLIALFVIQSRGSGRVGRLFGPVMAAWFVVLGLAGITHVLTRPGVLVSLDPRYALAYLGRADSWVAFTVLGSVFLALTGGEALYADMGHFGRRAIRIDWFALVMPALVLNYLGQGALVLADPSTAANPFFLMFPGWLLIPLVGLTTAATVIASQAVISGAFTLVQQGIQLGAVPRLEVRQTSEESAGQVYVPHINWLLVAAVLGLVFGFRSSDGLANAYGIAVAGDMLVTSVLVATVARGVWRWPLHLLLPVAGLFLALDLTFVSANLHKIPDGGWFPLIVGASALSLMLIWRRGRAVALAHRSADAMPLDAFLTSLAQPGAPVRVPGTAVYLTTQHDLVPTALALNLKHNGVLHERLVLLKVTTERAPRVSETARVVVEELSTGIRRVELRFGFAEKPDVPAALQAHAEEVGCDPATASFFLGREVPVPSLRPEVPLWQERIYAFMVRNAVSAPDYFLIPPQRVVELGTRIEI
ncbi:MAG: potassium transporter Kup [Alphaproteobacteria bacterium]|nr:MAG: potassium transporter Kup [Alphaproteobacteria bacterium]